jgi:excinuclease ABC subunit A
MIIYELLFARIGRTYSPILGKSKKNSVTDVVADVESFDLDSKWLLLAPIHLEEGRKLEDKLKALLQQGFARILVDNQMIRLDEIDQHKQKDVMLIIDRIVVKAEEEFYNRLADAVQTAFYEGKVSVIYKN